jgi:hypothetical protein
MEPQADSRTSGFIAFASGNPALAESLDSAAERIRESAVADVITWQSLNIGGKILIGAICEAIEDRQVFIADLTVLNPNVLFELGFAIARKKRIWLILDDSQARSRPDFERFELLTTIGYRGYSNSSDIVRSFFADQPYTSLEKTIYNDIFDVPVRHPPSKLLYLKSAIETDASIRMSRRVAQARFTR